MKKKLLFTGAGGVSTEIIWKVLKNKYDLFFGDINISNIFYEIPKEKKIKLLKANNVNFIQHLKKINKQYNFDLVIPGVDEEILSLINSNFSRNIFLPPVKFCKYTLNKLLFFDYLKKNKINNLNTYSLKDFNNFQNKSYIIKPKFGRGSRFVHKITKKTQVESFLNLYEKKKEDFIIQDFIKGNEYTVFVHANKKRCVIIPVRVFQKKGVTIDAKIENNLKIIKFIKNYLFKIFKVKNCFNVQIIIQNGKIFIIEINPRLSTTFALILKTGYDPFDENNHFNKKFKLKEIKMKRFLTSQFLNI